MKNYKWLKTNFKQSTTERIKEVMLYKNAEEINACPYLTYSRLFMYNPQYVQDTLFEYILHCKRTNKMACPKTGKLLNR